MTNHIPDLLVLGELREADAAVIHPWRADPSVRDGALGYPYPTDIEAERTWIQSFAPHGTPQNLCLGIRDCATNTLFGYFQLRNIDWIARTAEFGIVIGAPEARGRGVGKAAVSQGLHYATSQLGLRRLWLRVVDYNVAAIRLYEGAGFCREGCLVRHVYRNGALHDVYVYGWETTLALWPGPGRID